MNERFNEERPYPSRREKFQENPPTRKGRSKLLYIFLGIITIFIIAMGYNIMSSSEPVDDKQVASEPNQKENNTQDSNENTTIESNNNNSTSNEPTTNTDKVDQNENNQTNNQTNDNAYENNSDSNNNQSTTTIIGEEEWQPIGTKQDEPHVSSFDLDSIDWKEKVKAIVYATQLQEEKLIVWRLENGGTADTAIGTVSNYQEKETPYQVYLKWVVNEGWMPTKVIKLDQNPYLETDEG